VTADARERALQALYEFDLRDGVLEPLEGRAGRLFSGVIEHKAALDETLDGVSERWRVTRMAPVDRAVLRLALFELRYEPRTPTAVIVAEAVRLAKKYSTERSGTFVNGILGRVSQSER
jgi:N utilization substance protein B